MKLFIKQFGYYLKSKLLSWKKFYFSLKKLPALQVCMGIIFGSIFGSLMGPGGFVVVLIMLLVLRKHLILISSSAFLVIIFCMSNGSVLHTILNYQLEPGQKLNATVAEPPVQREFGESLVMQGGDGKKFLLEAPKYSGYQLGDLLEVEVSEFESLNKLDAGYSVYLASKGIYGTIGSDYVYVIENGYGVARSMLGIRRTFSDIIKGQLLPPESDLLEGVLVGEKASLSPDFKEDLQVSGLMHVVAVSGFNVMLIANFLNVLCGLVPRKFVYITTLIVIWLFLFLVGSDNLPAQRAVVMLTIVYIGLLIGRRIPMLLSLIYASTIMLLVNPLLWLNISWQLSFGAMVGVIVFSNILSKYWQAQSEIGSNFITTIAVILTTGPISFISFGSFSLVGIVSNVLVVPIVPIITMLGMFALALNVVPNLANFLFQLIELILKFTVELIRILGGLGEGVVNNPIVAFVIVVAISSIILAADFKNFTISIENKYAEV